MEKHSKSQTQPFVLKKKNKKKAKDEMERLKQAEKKKRRLEKALATSAAIRFELEKKKQKKKEQQRLDEEGAAIAESVALHVLADEDADDTVQLMLSRSERYDHMDDSRSNSLSLKDHQGFKRSTLEGLGCECDAYGSVFKWNGSGISYPMSPGAHQSNYQVPFFEEAGHGKELSPGFIAAEALSALHIAESSCSHSFSGQGTETVVFDRMMGSNHLHNEVNFYNEY